MTLFDLLAPQLLADVNFPEAVDRVLRVLDIESLHAADNAEATVYTGILALGSGNDPEAGRGMSLQWGDARWREPRIRFRLTLPRDVGTGPRRICTDRHRPGTDADPLDFDPGDEYFR